MNIESLPYIDEILLHGMYHAILIGSPMAAGQITGIRLPKLPPNYSFIGASDIPGQKALSIGNTEIPLFAEGEILYTGQPVGILVGPTLKKLHELRGDLQVQVQARVPYYGSTSISSEYVCAKFRSLRGEPEEVFKKAPIILEKSYTIHPLYPWTSAPLGAIAEYEYDKLRIRLPTQWPFLVRDAVGRILGVHSRDIVVEPAHLGNHGNLALWYPALLACYVALATRLCKKPVRMLLGKWEELQGAFATPLVKTTIRSAHSRNGDILALEVHGVVQGGAYMPFVSAYLEMFGKGIQGTHAVEHQRIELYGITTNHPPAHLPEDGGFAAGVFCIEQHMALVARHFDRNPVELYHLGSTGSSSLPHERGALFSHLDTVCTMSDFYRKWVSFELLARNRKHAHSHEGPSLLEEQPLRGIGVSYSYQPAGDFFEIFSIPSIAVAVTLQKDGQLIITTSAQSELMNWQLLWAQLAGEILTIPLSKIVFTPLRTDMVPDSGPAISSSMVIITRLLLQAFENIRKKRFRNPLPIREEKILRCTPRSMTAIFSKYQSTASCVVEVEVNPITFTPLVKGVWFSIDGGAIFSEIMAKRSIELTTRRVISSLIQAPILFSAEGTVAALGTYHQPPDLPDFPITVEFSWTSSTHSKGIGNLPLILLPAAYGKAISQAVYGTITDIPISPFDIVRVYKERKGVL
ncbi:MAG: molybdopterin-dependent oxidoreductase [Treponemataceae bacterium]|nr:molybdopterin-dependent oxidoreductase [Treponemataceae bacterium]